VCDASKGASNRLDIFLKTNWYGEIKWGIQFASSGCLFILDPDFGALFCGQKNGAGSLKSATDLIHIFSKREDVIYLEIK
jgi:hypothetical protein